METVAKRLYEGMFLVDSAQAAADWEGTLSVISTILQRADAEVVAMRKWQERKLAYDIDHKTRGTYILTYFKADSQRIAGIEKDVLLSEKVMRVLVLGTEKRPAEVLQSDITGEPEEKVVAASEGGADKAAKTSTATPTPEAQAQPTEASAETAPAAAAGVSEAPAGTERPPESKTPGEDNAPVPESAGAPAEEPNAEDAEKAPE